MKARLRVDPLEAKLRDPARWVEPVRQALLASGRQDFTPADAAALSGVPLDLAQPVLLALTRTEASSIRVTPEGGLVFHLLDLATPALPATRLGRLARHLSTWWRDHRADALGVLTMILGPWLLILLAWNLEGGGFYAQGAGGVLTTVGGLLLMAGRTLYLVALFLVAFFQLLPISVVIIFVYVPVLLTQEGMKNYHEGTLTVVRVIELVVYLLGAMMLGGWYSVLVSGLYKALVVGKHSAWSRKLWAELGGFLFGPLNLAHLPLPRLGHASPSTPPDAPQRGQGALRAERRVTALIRARQGVVSTADLVGATAWPVAVAEQALTRILVDYGGDVAVTSEGVVLYLFDALLDTASPVEPAEPDSPPASPDAQEPQEPAQQAPSPDAQEPLEPAQQPASQPTPPEDPLAPLTAGPKPAFWASHRATTVSLFALLALSLVSALVTALRGGALLPPLDGPLGPPGAQGFDFQDLTLVPTAWPITVVLAVWVARLPFWRGHREAWRHRRGWLQLVGALGTHPDGAPLPGEDAAWTDRDLARLDGEQVFDDAGAPVGVRFPWAVEAQRAAARVREERADPAHGPTDLDVV